MAFSAVGQRYPINADYRRLKPRQGVGNRVALCASEKIVGSILVELMFKKKTQDIEKVMKPYYILCFALMQHKMLCYSYKIIVYRCSNRPYTLV
jgi:hypothetical protein